MLIELVKIANDLDGRGLVKEADALDRLLLKISSTEDNPFQTEYYDEESGMVSGEEPGSTEEIRIQDYGKDPEEVVSSDEDVVFHEPKPDGSDHESYVFKYYAIENRFKLLKSRKCRGVGTYFAEGSKTYNKLMSLREHWSKFPAEDIGCNRSDESDVFSGRQLEKVEALAAKAPGSQHGKFGSRHHRYEQPTLAELKWFIENGVRNILRYNGNGGDTEIDPDLGISISTSVENKFANYMSGVIGEKVNFYRLSAHDGYQAGSGYVGSISRALSIMDGGSSLIHCHHGADRTGMIVGAYLKSKGATDTKALWEYTVGFNSWERNICRGINFGYAKYLDGFYPLDQWCEDVKSGELAQNRCSNPPVCGALGALGFRSRE
jgi:hypothetical protein